MSPFSRERMPVALRAELLAIYAETDRLFSDVTCDASTECCRFGVTGREPYPTAIESAELLRALASTGKRLSAVSAGSAGSAVRAGSGASGPARKQKRRLALEGEERRCPMLSAEGRCVVYASRPFGCRTFFCDRAEGALPRRQDVTELSRRIASLSARFFPSDPGPRPLTRLF